MEEMEGLVEGLDSVSKQIDCLYNQLRGLYGCVFPELESIVVDPITYARVIKKIHTALCNVTEEDEDISDILPPATVMVVNIMISSSLTSTSSSSIIDSDNIIDLCDQIIALASQKQKQIHSIESAISITAPNLSALVGGIIAAKLIGSVCGGGVSGLANMPSCNLQCLGALETNKTLIGFSSSSSSSLFRMGYIQDADIIQMFTPPQLRLHACRLLAAKSTLAVRVDFARTDPFGNAGKKMREEIVETIQKWQIPHPTKIVQSLVVPQFDKPRKKRGGRRLRKMKERYAMTALRTRANRVLFGVPEDTSLW